MHRVGQNSQLHTTHYIAYKQARARGPINHSIRIGNYLGFNKSKRHCSAATARKTATTTTLTKATKINKKRQQQQ